MAGEAQAQNWLVNLPKESQTLRCEPRSLDPQAGPLLLLHAHIFMQIKKAVCIALAHGTVHS